MIREVPEKNLRMLVAAILRKAVEDLYKAPPQVQIEAYEWLLGKEAQFYAETIDTSVDIEKIVETARVEDVLKSKYSKTKG